MAAPMCSSISMIFSKETGSIRVEGNLLSTAKTTPSFVLIPIEVVPNYFTRLDNKDSYFNGLNRIFDLEDSTFGGEGVNSSVILRSSRR